MTTVSRSIFFACPSTITKAHPPIYTTLTQTITTKSPFFLCFWPSDCPSGLIPRDSVSLQVLSPASITIFPVHFPTNSPIVASIRSPPWRTFCVPNVRIHLNTVELLPWNLDKWDWPFSMNFNETVRIQCKLAKFLRVFHNPFSFWRLHL
jgi:hypothetical protein